MKIPMAFGKSVLTMILGLFVAAGLGVLPQPLHAQSGIEDVVIFATNSAALDRDTDVQSGDVVVNDFRPGPKLLADFELRIDKDLTLGPLVNVKANRIRAIHPSVAPVLSGKVECNAGIAACSGLVAPRTAFLTNMVGANEGSHSTPGISERPTRSKACSPPPGCLRIAAIFSGCSFLSSEVRKVRRSSTQLLASTMSSYSTTSQPS